MELREQIKKEIKEMADSQYKEFHSQLCPGTQNILGVRIPVLREYAKKLNKQYSLSQIIAEVEDEYYEETMLKGIAIGLNKKAEIDQILEYAECFIPKINNWAVCDVFCGGLKITNKNKEKVWHFIQKYLNSDKEFEIRFGLVMILGYYVENDYIEKNFRIFEQIKNTEYYVKMAKAWAISVHLVKFYEETIAYLKNSQIDIWTYNKAIQKALESYRITNRQKQELRKMKK